MVFKSVRHNWVYLPTKYVRGARFRLMSREKFKLTHYRVPKYLDTGDSFCLRFANRGRVRR